MRNYINLDIEQATDEQLIDVKEDIIGELTKVTNGAIDGQLNTLLEVERELTLRERL